MSQLCCSDTDILKLNKRLSKKAKWEQISSISKALSHPARLQILELLRKQDSKMCTDIVGKLPIAQATVSQHLKMLKGAGLILGETHGKSTCYCVNEQRIKDYQDFISTMHGLGD